MSSLDLSNVPDSTRSAWALDNIAAHLKSIAASLETLAHDVAERREQRRGRSSGRVILAATDRFDDWFAGKGE